MKQLILVKYGEIILKGLNRPIFEDALVKNIKAALPKDCRGCVHRAQATIYVEPDDPSIIDEVLRRLSKVFGITYLTRAFVLPKDLEAIKTGAAEVLAPALKNAVSFKVEAKRADKKFPYTSPEISKEVGGYLHDCFPHLTVDVNTPAATVMVEVREQNAYVYCGREKGAGGMPVGSNSKATLLLSGGIDSPVAGYMTAKRGVRLNAVHFFSYPYTGERAKDKVMSLAKILAEYCPRLDVHIVPFTEAQLAIKKNCPPEQLTISGRVPPAIIFARADSHSPPPLPKTSSTVTFVVSSSHFSTTLFFILVDDDAPSVPCVDHTFTLSCLSGTNVSPS